jgi:hypothetical protein
MHETIERSSVLSPGEISEITRRVKHAAQREQLTQLGIPYRIRADGSPVVLRAAMEIALGYTPPGGGSASPRLRLPVAARPRRTAP